MGDLMSKKLLIVSFLTSIFCSQFSFAANLISLEALINGTIDVRFLWHNGLSINDLVVEYENRQDLKERDKKQFLKKYKNKLNGLSRQESYIKRKHEPKRRLKNFYGNADQAENANAEQLNFYDAVRETLAQMYNNNLLNNRQSDACLFNVAKLRRLHMDNYQICQELSLYGHSETYGKGPALHFEDRALNFELKAGILFDTLKKAYLFAERHNLLRKMFCEFAKGHGCLEARFARLSKWHKEQSAIHEILSPSYDNEKSQTLEITAQEAVTYWMQAYLPELDSMPEIKGEARKSFVKRIRQAFGGAKGCDGQRITSGFIQKLFEQVLLLTPESSIDSNECSSRDAE